MLDGLDVVEALEENREQAVVLHAGCGGEAFGDFALDGHHDAGRRGGEGGQFHQQARGDGVGEVGDELGFRRGQQRGQVAVENVRLNQAQGGGVGEAFAEIGREAFVFFHGGYGFDGIQQGGGQDAEAGADFQNGIVRLDIGFAQKDIQDVAVNQKVLAEDARGAEVQLRQQCADFRRAGQNGLGIHFWGVPAHGVLVFGSRVGAAMREAEKKIWERQALGAECARLRELGRKIVFTNGAFDLMHAGHATYLEFARRQGDVLIAGVNSDASVRRYKGEKRPIVDERNRMRMLAALECVDYVTMFDEDEPKELIGELMPDVLVKAEDWAHYVSGRDIVEAAGGTVVLAPMVQGLSTTNLIGKILTAYADKPQS